MRVLFDTNILVSFLLTSRITSPVVSIVHAAYRREFTLLVPQLLLDELAEVVRSKPYLARGINPQEFASFVHTLLINAELLPPASVETETITRDPKDDYLIAYALLGEADYLVTDDEDLLSLPTIQGLKIVSPAAFAEILSS